MKPRNLWIIMLLTVVLIGALPVSASAESERETFLKNFDAEYIWANNPYSKPLGILKTTESGISVLLDRVLVTEDELAVSFLISGDFPQELVDVQLIAQIEIGPRLPYPADSFEIAPRMGVLGVGGPSLFIANDNPLVAVDIASVPLMTQDGHVSPSDPIQVKIRIPKINVGWEGDTDDNEITWVQYYYDEELLEFEFETDGAELAALTQTIPLDYTFEIEGNTYEFHRLRFNPMHLILFTGEMRYGDDIWDWYAEGVRYVIAAPDDGHAIYLDAVDYPYRGFTAKIFDPDVIEMLKQTKTLTLTPCYLPDQSTSENPSFYPPWLKDSALDCSPEHAVTVNIRA